MPSPYDRNVGTFEEELADRVVVVTGAGSGIGAATAASLLGSGARVVAGDLRTETMSELTERWGDRVLLSAGDVGNPATADTLIAAATRTEALPPPNGGGAPRAPVAAMAIRWGTALTPRTVRGRGLAVRHLTCVRCTDPVRSAFPARERTDPAPA